MPEPIKIKRNTRIGKSAMALPFLFALVIKCTSPFAFYKKTLFVLKLSNPRKFSLTAKICPLLLYQANSLYATKSKKISIIMLRKTQKSCNLASWGQIMSFHMFCEKKNPAVPAAGSSKATLHG